MVQVIEALPFFRLQTYGAEVIMATQEYQFELKNDLSELEALHQHLNDWGERIGLPADAVPRIIICLDELFTNIVSYGFDDDLAHIIKFKLKGNTDLVVIDIEDKGIPFNPLDKVDPDFPENVESAKIGGLGIMIIRKLMDSVSYARQEGKNRLTMRKKIQETR